MGNPNCFNITVTVSCEIDKLQCNVSPNSFIISPNEKENISITVYGNLTDKEYRGKIYTVYHIGTMGINVDYNLIVYNSLYNTNVKKESSSYPFLFIAIVLLVFILLNFIPK